MNLDFLSSQPDGNISAELHFMGKTYVVSRFLTSLSQPTDEKGEPQMEVQGGLLAISLSQAPDNVLLQWAYSRWSRKNGELVFKNETGTPPLRIGFVDAACVDFSQKSSSEKGIVTTMVVSPHSVSFNGVVLDKEWRE